VSPFRNCVSANCVSKLCQQNFRHVSLCLGVKPPLQYGSLQYVSSAVGTEGAKYAALQQIVPPRERCHPHMASKHTAIRSGKGTRVAYSTRANDVIVAQQVAPLAVGRCLHVCGAHVVHMWCMCGVVGMWCTCQFGTEFIKHENTSGEQLRPTSN
jgi:hypothetical protein